MRQLKLLGLAVMAIFSVSVAVMSSAQAAELLILPEKLKFNFASTVGVNTKLETLAGKKIECKKVSGTGEFTSVRLGTVEFKFIECEEPTLKVKCKGLSDTTEGTITVKGEFHIRHLLPNTEGVNIAVLVTSIHFTCSIVLFVVSGCVASMDLLTVKGGESAVGKLRESVYASFLQEKGDQKPTEIDTDNSLGMEKCELTTKEGNAAGESSGQLGEGELNGFTNAKGEKVTALIDLSGTF